MTAGRSVVSGSVHWCTPPKYVEAVRQAFGGKIELDPCSNEWSVVRAETEWMVPTNDGLAEQWNYGTVYVNPPYGADREQGTTIRHWLHRCADAHERYGSEVLALVPVAANTSHWKRYVWGRAAAVCFLYDTRLKFLENGRPYTKGAPMACAMVYWGREFDRFFSVFIEFGAVVDLIPFHIAEAVKCAGRLRVECSIQSQAVSDRTRPGSDSSSPRYASTASIFSSMLPYILPSTHLRTSWNTRSAGFNSGLYGGWMMVASPTLRTISPR